MSDFVLNVRNGHVRYIERTAPGPTSVRETTLDAARWLIEDNPPFRSHEFEGYPIAVRTERGSEYFLEGVWPEKNRKKRKK